MPTRIEYKKGDKLGPYNIEFVEEIEPYVSPRGYKQRIAIFKCPLCDKLFNSAIGSIKNGLTKSCKCARKKNLTGKKFGHLTVIKDSGQKDKYCHILWECQCDCNNSKIILVPSSQLIRGHTRSCGCNRESRGEEKIRIFLQSLNINFNSEKIFNKCKNLKTNTSLRFDFYLSDYNCCIEYDGEQHFKESSLCSDTLEERQYRDSIKNQYCKDNNIKLIRIPYTEFDNIEEILTKELNL